MIETKRMRVPVSKGKAFAIIDPEDFEIVNGHKWSLHTQGYAVKNRPGETIYMHQLILKTKFIDHINGNKLDNRKGNLRPTNHVKNAQNTGPRDGYKGVTWDKSRGKWKAFIMVRGVGYNIGRFKKEKDAAKAYDEKAKELCENPYLNFG